MSPAARSAENRAVKRSHRNAATFKTARFLWDTHRFRDDFKSDVSERIFNSRFSLTRAAYTHVTTPTPVGYSVAPQRDSIWTRVVFSKLVLLPGAHNYRLPFLRCSPNVCTCRLKGRDPRRMARLDTDLWLLRSVVSFLPRL